ncbi:MAG: DUF5666 domain-containing protein [Myxococcota bacterium]|jgi:hypothetical protein|nr:DUF5666 domain-containing protein [Myxococcota bacterium]
MAIESTLRGVRATWVVVLALLFSLPAQAQNPCAPEGSSHALELAQSDTGSGIGGTGRGGGDDSGIGGTGRGGDDSGFGGTGFSDGDDSGIGGTGIYGTITAFGSICVNGLRVHYDEATPVDFDGNAADASMLEVGQVVAVEAAGRGSELRAKRVGVHSVLTGPVTAIDGEAASLEVMGARVALPEDMIESVETLEVGTRVSISGLRRNDGIVVATLLSRAAPETPDAVAGLARIDASQRIDIGGIPVAAAGEVVPGTHLRATGRYDVRSGAFDVQRLDASTLLARETRHLSVEGYVHEIGSEGRLFLPGVEVDRSSLERAGAAFDRETSVRVSGRRDKLGRLRVERVQRLERQRIVRDGVRSKGKVRSVRATRGDKLENSQKTSKPNTRVRPERVKRDRLQPPPKPVRPPRIDRPPKVDRPTVIDSSILDSPGG